MTDEELKQLASGCDSVAVFVAKLGHKSHSTYTKCYKPRLEMMGIHLNKSQHRHSESEFRNAAKNANSIREIAKRLGLRARGGNYKTIKRRLQELGLEVVPTHHGPPTPTSKKRPIEEYLVINGPQITSSKLRKRLINEGIKKNECEICDQEPIWNKQPLTMQLDHINGNSDDNRLINLRILCPNCYTQTPTHSRLK